MDGSPGWVCAAGARKQARRGEAIEEPVEGMRIRCCLRGMYDEAPRGTPNAVDVASRVASGGLPRQNPRRTASATICRSEVIVRTSVLWRHAEAGLSFVSCYPYFRRCQRRAAGRTPAGILVNRDLRSIWSGYGTGKKAGQACQPVCFARLRISPIGTREIKESRHHVVGNSALPGGATDVLVKSRKLQCRWKVRLRSAWAKVVLGRSAAVVAR